MSSLFTDETLDHFCSITGVSRNEGRHLLESCHGNVQTAIGLHYDSGSNASGQRAPIPQVFKRLVDAHDDPHGARYHGDAALGWNKLEELFSRPPMDLIFRGSFTQTCDHAAEANKWLIVNVQNPGELPCHQLNAVVWNSPEVKKLIKKSFVLWQVPSSSPDGERFVQFYRVNKWPQVSAIDPRTGEKVLDFDGSALLSGSSFCQVAVKFLAGNKAPEEVESDSDDIFNGDDDDVTSNTEEEQLRLALRASEMSSTDYFFEYSDDDDDKEEEEKMDCDTDDDDDNFSPESPVSKIEEQPKELTIEDCLGPSTDPMTKLLLRLASGERKMLEWPCSTKLRALFLYVKENGYEKFEIVTNFPRTVIDMTKMDEMTLLDAKMHPQQVLFVSSS